MDCYIPNASFLTNVYNDRITFLKVLEAVLKPEITSFINTNFIDDVKIHELILQHQYESMDYRSAFNDINVELKTLRTGTFHDSSYDSIDLMTIHEYNEMIKTTDQHGENALTFLFVYFHENNTMFFLRIEKETKGEFCRSIYGI